MLICYVYVLFTTVSAHALCLFSNCFRNFTCRLLRVLYIVSYWLFVRYVACKYFLPIDSLSCYPPNKFFHRTFFFFSVFMRSGLLIFIFMIYDFGVNSQNSLLSLRFRRLFFPSCFSIRLIVLCLIFKIMIHFVFVQDITCRSMFSFFNLWMSSCSALFVEKAIFNPLNRFCSFVNHHLNSYLLDIILLQYIYFCVLYSVLLICVAVSLPTIHFLGYCNTVGPNIR